MLFALKGSRKARGAFWLQRFARSARNKTPLAFRAQREDFFFYTTIRAKREEIFVDLDFSHKARGFVLFLTFRTKREELF